MAADPALSALAEVNLWDARRRAVKPGGQHRPLVEAVPQIDARAPPGCYSVLLQSAGRAGQLPVTFR